MMERNQVLIMKSFLDNYNNSSQFEANLYDEFEVS